MEFDPNAFNQMFYRTLEQGIAKLPQNEREALYRPCAEACAKCYVLGMQQRQFEECGGDLDKQYEKYGKSEYFFANIIEPGHVYEIGYPRCLCTFAECGFAASETHCECSRQSILFVLHTLLPGRDIQVETLHTVLGGAEECRFRVRVE